MARTIYKGGSPLVFSLFNESIRRGWSYKMIAYQVGVGASTVSSWWSGDRAPGVENVEKWARALGGFLVLSLPVPEPQEREIVGRTPEERAARDWRALERGKIGYAGRGR